MVYSVIGLNINFAEIEYLAVGTGGSSGPFGPVKSRVWTKFDTLGRRYIPENK